MMMTNNGRTQGLSLDKEAEEALPFLCILTRTLALRARQRYLLVFSRGASQGLHDGFCNSNARSFTELIIPRRQLDILPRPAGGLEQRVEVVGGVRPICQAGGSQNGVRDA